MSEKMPSNIQYLIAYLQNVLPLAYIFSLMSLRWCQNGHHSISNHQPHHCLLNRLLRRRSNKTSEVHVTGLCGGNSPMTGEFPAQRASNAENVSIWWRHHVLLLRLRQNGHHLQMCFRNPLVMTILLGVCRSQGSLFGPRFLSQRHIFCKNSLAKGIFVIRSP